MHSSKSRQPRLPDCHLLGSDGHARVHSAAFCHGRQAYVAYQRVPAGQNHAGGMKGLSFLAGPKDPEAIDLDPCLDTGRLGEAVCSSGCSRLTRLSAGLSVCFPLCFSVGLPFCLSVCLSAFLSVCLLSCLSAYLSVCWLVRLLACLVCLPVCLFACLSPFCLLACLSACLSVCWPVCLPVYLLSVCWLVCLLAFLSVWLPVATTCEA